MHNLFLEFTIILAVAALIGFVGLKLKQPLIVSFIAVGILLGPAVLGVVQAGENLNLLAHLGIAILLFVVGLKLDIHIIKSMGIVALATGMGQVIFTSLFGFVIAYALGMDATTALYVAVALTFSSTIIIVKLLSDKKELETLHGKIAIGFLIVQDIVVVLAMIALTTMGTHSDANPWLQIAVVFGKGALMLLLVAFLMRFVLPLLLKSLAKSPEMLILFAVAWAVLGASFGSYMGFSQEVGAFLAGITIASTPFRDMIGARLVSLRDFLLLFFFINLGASLELNMLGAQMGNAVILSLFVLIGNPIIVMIIMGYMGYRKRTGLLAGFTVAQISEFSLILAALGYSLGHISQEAVGLVTLVGLITISASTYMIIYSHHVYELLAPYLSLFERKIPYREVILDQDRGVQNPEIVIFGMGRFGLAMAKALKYEGKKVLGIDFNPELLHEVEKEQIAIRYGDIEDPEFIAHLNLQETQWVVGAVRDKRAGVILVDTLKALRYSGKIALAAHTQKEAHYLETIGVDLILIPYHDAALEAVQKIIHSQE